jgi:hypothetical protein
VFYFHSIDILNEKFPEVGKGRLLYGIVKGKVVEKRIRYILTNLKDVNKVCLKDAVG